MPGITLPTRSLSLVRNRSVPVLCAHVQLIAAAGDILSEPLIRPYRSAVSLVNGITLKPRFRAPPLPLGSVLCSPAFMSTCEYFTRSQAPDNKLIVSFLHWRPDCIHPLPKLRIFLPVSR